MYYHTPKHSFHFASTLNSSFQCNFLTISSIIRKVDAAIAQRGFTPWFTARMILQIPHHRSQSYVLAGTLILSLDISFWILRKLFGDFFSVSFPQFSSSFCWLLICRMSSWNESSTKVLSAAEVSKNGQSQRLAKHCPSSVLTCDRKENQKYEKQAINSNTFWG